jgi:hypothetical protein
MNFLLDFLKEVPDLTIFVLDLSKTSTRVIEICAKLSESRAVLEHRIVLDFQNVLDFCKFQKIQQFSDYTNQLTPLQMQQASLDHHFSSPETFKTSVITRQRPSTVNPIPKTRRFFDICVFSLLSQLLKHSQASFTNRAMSRT